MAEYIFLRPVYFTDMCIMFGRRPTDLSYTFVLQALSACGVGISETTSGHMLRYPVDGQDVTIALHRDHHKAETIPRLTVIKIRNSMRRRWGWSRDTFRVVGDEDNGDD
ncbi:hypothetical protein QCA50_016974 [Cerrena zonata]|uniref:Type II toxin-antitoxin system HicA family toxin n=1 Tax=Cerrena zonata TaxID=2478898 RepID=A0AAW0FR94_9APHY